MERHVIDVSQVVSAIPDSATVALCGSGTLTEPDLLMEAIEHSFLTTGHPRNLTIVHALGIGNGQGSGLTRLAHERLVKRVIGGHWSWSAEMQALARDNRIEAYSLPAGVIMTLMREVGARRPGLITRIGLGTFVDPRIEGGKCNDSATEDLVELIELEGQQYLHYKPIHIDIALIKGSIADPRGSVSLLHETADLDTYALALAAHNCGGKVFVQTRELAEAPIVPARLISIPGILVDAVIHHPEQPQSILGEYDDSLSGETRPKATLPAFEMPTGIRYMIAARAAQEITESLSLNFGFGIPGGIPALLHQDEYPCPYWGSIEQGIHNGHMLDGAMFGSARYPEAIVSSVDQFDFYSGGGVDIAFLGMGEMDAQGNVNVSMFGSHLIGPGGFIDITQGAKKVVFCGTFEAKGLKVCDNDGALEILQPGAVPKLVNKVNHITFSGKNALDSGQEVVYVTERAVFRLGAEGIELIEVVHGVDLQRNILDRIQFRPLIKDVNVVDLVAQEETI